MTEKTALTEKWYRRKSILRCLALAHNCGIETELFLSCIDCDLQAEARSMIREKKFVNSDGAMIKPAPLAVSALQIKGEAVLRFIENLFLVLDGAVSHFKPRRTESPEELAGSILAMADRFRPIAPLHELEKNLLGRFSPLIEQLRLPRIGGLDHLKSELRHAHNLLSVIHFRRFGDERINALRRFHQEKGQDICLLLHKAIEIGCVSGSFHEAILRLMIRYAGYGEFLCEEMLAASKALLALQEARSASPDDLADTHMSLSNAYLAAHNSEPNWSRLSDYHLERFFEYASFPHTPAKAIPAPSSHSQQSE